MFLYFFDLLYFFVCFLSKNKITLLGIIDRQIPLQKSHTQVQLELHREVFLPLFERYILLLHKRLSQSNQV